MLEIPAIRGGWDYLLLSITESGRCVGCSVLVMPEPGSSRGRCLVMISCRSSRWSGFGVSGVDREVAEHDAHDLKDWFTYLDGHGRDWRSATLEDVAGFVAWLRLPPRARDGKVSVLPTVERHCSAASVNRKLASLTSFCGFHPSRRRADRALVVMQPAADAATATAYKPFSPRGQAQARAASSDQAESPLKCDESPDGAAGSGDSRRV